MQTADNWASDPTQCAVPGYGYPVLFNGSAPYSYPITYDQKQTCEGIVFSVPLVDTVSNLTYAQMYVWKDYTDRLFVTVSINATAFVAPTLDPSTDTANGGLGQFLHASPSIFNPSLPSGRMTISGAFISNPGNFYNYDSTNLLTSTLSSWSCFTYAVNLKRVCQATTSTFKKGTGCVLRGTDNPGVVVDLSATANLFFNVQFNITRFSFLSANNLYCGDAATANNVGSFEYEQLLIQPLSGTVDLYTVVGLGEVNPLPRACSTLLPSPAPPLPPSPVSYTHLTLPTKRIV